MSREASKAHEDAVVEQLEDNDANVIEENGEKEDRASVPIVEKSKQNSSVFCLRSTGLRDLVGYATKLVISGAIASTRSRLEVSQTSGQLALFARTELCGV